MNYSDYLKKTQEYGVTEQVKYPIVFLSGLPDATPNEVIIFESGQLGRVIGLDQDLVQVMLFDSNLVEIGSQATRTLEKLSLGVGEQLKGKVINPLGIPLFSELSKYQVEEYRPIDILPPGISSRARIDKPFLTGSAIVDTLLPLGKGQRELVVGDRKTGKTAFVLTAVKTQVQAGTVVVYAAIGKRKTEIKKLKNFFESEKINNQVVIVASAADDSPSLIYLTPFSAMTVAEFFCNRGQDVLVIFDDLTTHAKFYREISLLGHKFPGRESYPGDMFYTHARLLERAGNFKHPAKGSVSVTALPMAETIEGDLRGYIVSNLISITDGHILFSNSIFNSGRKPAVDVFLSVTRVGKQTRGSLERDLATQITAFLSQYDKLENVSHFGSELSGETNKILDAGKKIFNIFDQDYRLVIPAKIQQMMVIMIFGGLFETQPINEIKQYRDKLISEYSRNTKLQQQIDDIVSSDSLEHALTKLSQQGASSPIVMEILTIMGIKKSQESKKN